MTAVLFPRALIGDSLTGFLSRSKLCLNSDVKTADGSSPQSFAGAAPKNVSWQIWNKYLEGSPHAVSFAARRVVARCLMLDASNKSYEQPLSVGIWNETLTVTSNPQTESVTFSVWGSTTIGLVVVKLSLVFNHQSSICWNEFLNLSF